MTTCVTAQANTAESTAREVSQLIYYNVGILSISIFDCFDQIVVIVPSLGIRPNHDCVDLTLTSYTHNTAVHVYFCSADN